MNPPKRFPFSELLPWLVAAGYVFLIAQFLLVFNSDELAFDAVGYAVRYLLAFQPWSHAFFMGVPLGTFDQPFPSVIPLLFSFLGLGQLTLPYALSVLLFRLLVPFTFLLLPGENKWEKLAAGLVLVLNPITFNFLNRLYEAYAWLFFIPALILLYRFLESEKTDFRLLLGAIAAAVLSVLSSSVTVIFLGLAGLAMISSIKDLKRLALFGASVAGLSAFWFLPYLTFLPYSVVSFQAGLSELRTFGILSSGLFLAAVFLFLLLQQTVTFSFRQKNLLRMGFVLSLLILLPLNWPLLGKLFAHSYHVFFLLLLMLLFFFTQTQRGNWKKLLFSLRPLAVVGILGLAFMAPYLFSQYVYHFPLLSEKQYLSPDGTAVSLPQALEVISTLPSGSRFEALPADYILGSAAILRYPLQTFTAFGFDAYGLSDSMNLQKKLSQTDSCDSLREAARTAGITHFVALTRPLQSFLNSCGFPASASPLPSIHETGYSLLENGKLMALESDKIVLEIRPPSTLLKVNYFPRWQAPAGTLLEDAHPGMRLYAETPRTIELRYGPVWTDYLGMVLSLLTLAFLFILFRIINR
ncbi:MAG: hypothetical protein HY917_03430 [Candidatus Diapherotrites archaeon]|nr:hypothetical protein [Candidatus Diapherotrites archaeon]